MPIYALTTQYTYLCWMSLIGGSHIIAICGYVNHILELRLCWPHIFHIMISFFPIPYDRSKDLTCLYAYMVHLIGPHWYINQLSVRYVPNHTNVLIYGTMECTNKSICTTHIGPLGSVCITYTEWYASVWWTLLIPTI